MKSMIEKLKKHAGETITEVLVALLISTIGLLMLATMITSSGNAISKSRDILEKYYSTAAETDNTAQIIVKNTKKTDETYTFTVNTERKALGGKMVISYSGGTLNPEGGSTP